jgi:hypothetical protein
VCAVRSFQVNQDRPKLNRTYRLFVYVDGVDILGGSVPTINRYTDASVVASKKNGIEVNANKTNYLVMSGDQIARKKSLYED